jgi:hypothetical protein
VLSITGAAGNVLVILLVTFVFPSISSSIAHGGYDDGAGENNRYDEDYDLGSDHLIETPCFSFTGPAGWINHQKDAYDADCAASLEDHGPLDASGRYQFGESYASVRVSPVYDDLITGSDPIELDGAAATAETTASEQGSLSQVVISVVMPERRTNYYGEFEALSVEISAPPEDLDALVDQVVGSWTWR